MANPNPSPGTRFRPGFRGGPGSRPKGLAHYIHAQTHKGVELVNWYLGIWRGEQAPLGRVPKAAERFEAAETLLAYGWGRPPQYVDLALASTEVRRIEVTFDAAPVEGNGSASSVVVDVAPASTDGVGDEQPKSHAPPRFPPPHSRND